MQAKNDDLADQIESLKGELCSLSVAGSALVSDGAPGDIKLLMMLPVMLSFMSFPSKSGGKHRIPAYGHGATAFPGFLTLMASQSKPSEATYYQQCGKMKLGRQVCSRYFVPMLEKCFSFGTSTTWNFKHFCPW